MTENEVNLIEFVRCYRIGKRTLYSGGINTKRPIIVRFQNFSDRSVVWGKRFQLKDKNYSISANFAYDIEYRRRLLYPVLVVAKKSGKYDKKAFLNGDVLLINNVLDKLLLLYTRVIRLVTKITKLLCAAKSAYW